MGIHLCAVLPVVRCAMTSISGLEHPIGLYLKVWGLLFVLSTMSYLVDYFHFHSYLRWGLIITFMLMRAGLINAVFMHMAWERLALMYAILLPPLCLLDAVTFALVSDMLISPSPSYAEILNTSSRITRRKI